MCLLAEIPLRFEPSPLLLPIAVVVVVGVAMGVDAMVWIGLGARRRKGRLTLVGVGLLAATAGAAVGTFFLPILVGLPMLSLAALWLAIRGYQKTTSETRPWVKRVLLGLRIAVVLLLLAFLARPILHYTHVEQERTAVLMLVDASKSMSVKDVDSGGPMGMIRRDQAVTETLGRSGEAYQRLVARYDVFPYRFAQRDADGKRTRILSPNPMNEFSPVATGEHTAIGDALYGAYQKHLAGAVAAAFVLTDGANTLTLGNSPRKAARLLAGRGVRVYLVPFGSSRPLAGMKDVIIRHMDVKTKVAAYNTTPVKVRLDLIGLANRDVTVELHMDGVPMPGKRETVVAARDQETRSIEFAITPTEPGFHKLTVVAKPPPNVELASDNNRMSAYIQVVDEGIRVLYLTGKFRWETKYISKTLATYQDIRFSRRVFFKPPGMRGDVVLPDSPEAWARYHVVILADLAAKRLTRKQINDLHEAVDKLGTGFMMAGGYQSFGAGGYSGTKIADLLPVEIRPADGQIDKPLKVMATVEGIRNRIMLLVPAEGRTPETLARDNAQAWERLPDVQGASRVGPPKALATVLARANDKSLVLATAPYGKGRTAALTVDTTWQWYFNPEEEDTSESHKRFWRQLILWLANRKPSVWIAADRGRYQLPLIMAGRQKVGLIAGVTDADGRPMTNADLDVQVQPEGGAGRRVRMIFNEKTGLFEPAESRLIAEVDGDYKVTLTASSGGKVVGTSTTRFLVYSPDIELLNALADIDGLKEMALAAGDLGRIIQPEDLAKTFDELDAANITRSRVRTEIVDLPDVFRWHLFAAILTLLTAEWALRKRKGLV